MVVHVSQSSDRFCKSLYGFIGERPFTIRLHLKEQKSLTAHVANELMILIIIEDSKLRSRQCGTWVENQRNRCRPFALSRAGKYVCEGTALRFACQFVALLIYICQSRLTFRVS